MTLDDWFDHDRAATRLVNVGMSSECAADAAECFAKAAGQLQPHARGRSVVACWAPGRIEVLGKHTDYCGGSSILAAAERGFCMLATPREDGVVAIVDPKNPIRSVVLDKNTAPTLGHWSNYPHTVVRRLAKNFPQANRGATIAFASNLPAAAGMSSSSAFIVGTFLLLSQTNDLEQDETYQSVIRTKEDLAGYLSTIENGMSFGPLTGDKGVGTFGGSEDHVAILCAKPGALVEYSYCPIKYQRTINFADDYAFAIASSGVVAEKTGDALHKYNQLSADVRTIADFWRRAANDEVASLAEALQSTHVDGAKLRDALLANAGEAEAADLITRLEHYEQEAQLIRGVPDSIDSATIERFGQTAQNSHQQAHRLLKNQTPETNRLVELAAEQGAAGASAFGAGFGGSVWALVSRPAALQFLSNWQASYEREFAEASTRSEFFFTRPGIPAICNL